MANLASKVLNNEDWKKAEDLLGITLEAGTTYTLQARKGAYVCGKSTKPLPNDGFYINETNNGLTKYTQKDDGSFLWVKVANKQAVFNIGV